MKNQKGITLIALVITIVILLILAGISISAVLGDNGILDKAKNAKLKTEIEREKEVINLAISSTRISDNGDIVELNTNKLKEEIEKSYGSNVDIDESIDKVTVVFKDTKREYEVDKASSNVELIDNSAEIVNTQEKTLTRKSNDNSTGNEKLGLSEEMQSGGTWRSSNSSIVSVDNSGNIEWKSIGKAKVTYTANGKREVFNIICEYAIVPDTDGWNVSHDCGTYGNSVIWGGSSRLSIGKGDNLLEVFADDNKYTYHVTMWRTVDLTNVNTIDYTGSYWKNTGSVIEGYKSGVVETTLVEGNLDANCVYKEGYSKIEDVTVTSKGIPISHNVSELSGEYIIAFTVTHANQVGHSNHVGYIGDILLKP